MQTILYLIRHGESEANAKKVFAGQTDVDLTDLGRKQAEMAASYLKNLAPDVIYASDLKRAYNTAKATADILGMEIITSKALREVHCGDWEMLALAYIMDNYTDQFKKWIHDSGHAQIPGGESGEILMNRVAPEIQRIAQRHPDQVVYIFTHATPIRAFVASLEEDFLEKLSTLPRPTNASVTKVSFDGERFRIVEFSRDDFIGEHGTAIHFPISK